MKVRTYMVPLFILLVISMMSCTQTNKRDDITTMKIMLTRESVTAYAPIVAGIEQGYFKDHGIHLEVQYNDAERDREEALLNGEVDLVASDQPKVLMNRDNKLPFVSVFVLTRMPLEREYETDYYGIVLIANGPKVKENILRYRDFANALTKGYFWVKNNPKDAVTLLNNQIDDQVSLSELEQMLALMEEDGMLFGSQSLTAWEGILAEMQEKNVVESQLKAHEAFVDLRD